MIAIISISIIMTAFYNLNKNLLVPIMIHQLFNFLIGISRGDVIVGIKYYAILYLVVAIIVVGINPRIVLYSNASMIGKKTNGPMNVIYEKENSYGNKKSYR